MEKKKDFFADLFGFRLRYSIKVMYSKVPWKTTFLHLLWLYYSFDVKSVIYFCFYSSLVSHPC